jgi:hypothetical protein
VHAACTTVYVVITGVIKREQEFGNPRSMDLATFPRIVRVNCKSSICPRNISSFDYSNFWVTVVGGMKKEQLIWVIYLSTCFTY